MPDPDEWQDLKPPDDLIPPPPRPPVEEPPPKEIPWWETLFQPVGAVLGSMQEAAEQQAPSTAGRLFLPHEGDPQWLTDLRQAGRAAPAPTVPQGATAEQERDIWNQWREEQTKQYDIPVQIGPFQGNINLPYAIKGVTELPLSWWGAASLIPGPVARGAAGLVAQGARHLPGVENLIAQSALSQVRNAPAAARMAYDELFRIAQEGRVKGVSLPGEIERLRSGLGLSDDVLRNMTPDVRTLWEREGKNVADAVRRYLGGTEEPGQAGKLVQQFLDKMDEAAIATDATTTRGERLARVLSGNLDNIPDRPGDMRETFAKWYELETVRALRDSGAIRRAEFMPQLGGNRFSNLVSDILFMPPGSTPRRLMTELFLGTPSFVMQQIAEPSLRGLATWVNPYVGFGKRATQFAGDLPKIVGKDEAARWLQGARERVLVQAPDLKGAALEQAAHHELLRSNMPEYLSHNWEMTYAQRYEGHPFMTVGYEGGMRGALKVTEVEQKPLLGAYTRHVRAIASQFDDTARGNFAYKGMIESLKKQVAKPTGPTLGKAITQATESIATTHGITPIELERLTNIAISRSPAEAVRDLRRWASGTWNPLVEDVTPGKSIVADIAPSVARAVEEKVASIIAKGLPVEETRQQLAVAFRHGELLTGIHELGVDAKTVVRVEKALDRAERAQTRAAATLQKYRDKVAAAEAKFEAQMAQTAKKGIQITARSQRTKTVNLATKEAHDAVGGLLDETGFKEILADVNDFLKTEYDEIMGQDYRKLARREGLDAFAGYEASVRGAIKPVYDAAVDDLAKVLRELAPDTGSRIDDFVRLHKQYYDELARLWQKSHDAWAEIGARGIEDYAARGEAYERLHAIREAIWKRGGEWDRARVDILAKSKKAEAEIKAGIGKRPPDGGEPPPPGTPSQPPAAPKPPQPPPAVPKGVLEGMTDRQIVDELELPRGSALEEKNAAEAARIMEQAAVKIPETRGEPILEEGRRAFDKGGLSIESTPLFGPPEGPIGGAAPTATEAFSMGRAGMRAWRDRTLEAIETGATGGQRAAAELADQLGTLMQHTTPQELGDWSRAANVATRDGAHYADYAFGNYNLTNNAVDALRQGPFWFAYFPLQAMQFWGGQLIEKPWLSQVARQYLDATERTWPQGTPDRMKKRGIINLESLHPNLKGYGINPMAMVSPWRWANPAPLYTDPEGGALSMLTDTVQRQTGMTLAPNFTYGLLLASKAFEKLGTPALFEQEVRSIVPQMDWLRAATAAAGFNGGKGLHVEALLGWNRLMYGRDTSRFHEWAVRKDLAVMETLGQKPNRQLAEQNVATREGIGMMMMGVRYGNPEEREFLAAKIAMNAAQSAVERKAIRDSKPFMNAWYQAGNVFRSQEEMDKEAKVNEAWGRMKAIQETYKEGIQLLREKAPGSLVLRKMKRDQAEEIAKWKAQYPDVANNQPTALELLSLRALNAKYNDQIQQIAKTEGIAAPDDPTYKRLIMERAKELAALKEKHPGMSTAAAYMNGPEFDALVNDLVVYQKLETWGKLLKDTEKMPKEQQRAVRDQWWGENPDVERWTRSRQTEAEKDYGDFWDFYNSIPRTAGLRSQVFKAHLPWLQSMGYEQREPPRPERGSAEEDIERRMTTIGTLRDQLRMLQEARPGDPKVRTVGDLIRWEYVMLQAAHPREAKDVGADDPAAISAVLKEGMRVSPQIMTQGLVEQIEFDRRMRKKGEEFGQLYERYRGNSDGYTEARKKFLEDNPSYGEWRAANRSEAQRDADKLWEGYYALSKGAARREYLKEHGDEFTALGYELGQGNNRGFAYGSGTNVSPANKSYLVTKWTEQQLLKTEAEQDHWMRDNMADLMAHGYNPQATTLAKYSPVAVAKRDQERADRVALDGMWLQYYSIRDGKAQATWLQQNLDKMIAVGWKPTSRQLGTIRTGLGLTGTVGGTTPRAYVPAAPRRGGGGGRPPRIPQKIGQIAPVKVTAMDWFKRRRLQRQRSNSGAA